MSKVDSFERTARRVRRTVRSLPLLEPVVNRAGMWLWHRHLDRLAADENLTLPAVVQVTQAQVRQRLATHRLPAAVLREDGDGAAEIGGDWDRGVEPITEGDEVRANVTAADGDTARPVIAFDRLGQAHLLSGDFHRAAHGDAPVNVKVALRHPRWARLARRVLAYAQQRDGSAYQPYLHPDLAHVPADHGEGRFGQILTALPPSSGILLDLGANSGYFSHRFAAEGFDCVAVERSVKEAYFLRALRDASEHDFRVVQGSLTDVALPAAEVTLALSIFHHFLKTEAGFRDLESFLGQLQTRHLVFEPHLTNDPQMHQAAHNPKPEEFANWVSQRARLKRLRKIGCARTGRPLFLLSAD